MSFQDMLRENRTGSSDKQAGFQSLIRSLGGGGALKRLRDANLLSSNTEIRDAQEQHQFNADIDRLRERLRDQRRGLLDPRGVFVQYWDMITMMALLWTMVVTPFEVSLNLETAANALFFLNILVSFVFLVDIFVQFVLPQPVHGSDKRGEAAYERRHWVLARNYMTSWFLLDVLTIIPFDVMVWQGAVDSEVKMIKILRVLRLLKIFKVLRASSIIQRWENSFAVQSTKQTLGSFALLTLIMLHWLACLWCLIATLQTPQRVQMEAEHPGQLEEQLLSMMDARGASCTGCIEDDPSTASVCRSLCLTPCELEAVAALKEVSAQYVFHIETWMCRAVANGNLTPEYETTPFSVYATALLVAMLQVVGGELDHSLIDSADRPPSPQPLHVYPPYTPLGG